MLDSGAPGEFKVPDLDPQQKKSLEAFWKSYEPVQAEVQDEIEALARELPGAARILSDEPDETRRARRERSIELQRRALLEGAWEPYFEDLRLQGAAYAQAGMAFSAWFDLIRAFRQAILSRVLAAGQPTEDLPEVLNGLGVFVDLAMANIGEAYLETREGIIARQRTAIRELSTPILQVHEQLLLLPVIGVVDTDRAKQLTEELLLAIQRHRARVVVIDITGVPIVDSKVANHLIQTIDAAKLMGVTVVVTGISPGIAQTMVTIGADLGRVRTMGSLRAGIEYAASILPLSVQSAGAGNGTAANGGAGEDRDGSPANEGRTETVERVRR